MATLPEWDVKKHFFVHKLMLEGWKCLSLVPVINYVTSSDLLMLAILSLLYMRSSQFNTKQGRRCKYDVTLKRARATIVVVEKL